MQIYSRTLFLEINNSNLIFSATEIDENNNLINIFRQDAPLRGIEKNRITSYEDLT